MILPNSFPELRQICTQRESYQVNDNELLPFTIEKNLAKLINLEISLFNDCDSLKNELVNSEVFDLKTTFNYLCDQSEKHIITLERLI